MELLLIPSVLIFHSTLILICANKDAEEKPVNGVCWHTRPSRSSSSSGGASACNLNYETDLLLVSCAFVLLGGDGTEKLFVVEAYFSLNPSSTFPALRLPCLPPPSCAVVVVVVMDQSHNLTQWMAGIVIVAMIMQDVLRWLNLMGC